jgi:isopenicillin N synthase-like dioxygenase
MTVTDDSAGVAARMAPLAVIDISPAFHRSRGGAAGVAAAVRAACQTLGMFGVVGHQVPGQAISDSEAVSTGFFALPAAEKDRYRPQSRLDYVGYYGVATLAAAASLGQSGPKDLFEAFSCGPYDDIRAPDDGEERLFGLNIWPERPAELRTVWLRYYREMEQLSDVLLRIFSLALGLGEDWLQRRCGGHLSELIVNHYPPQGRPKEPGQVRQGAHTDFGTFTILRASDGVPGLQVQSSGSWLAVPHVAYGFVVNVADLLTQWSNGLWISPVHRVDNPPPEYARVDRMTIPYFHNPAADARVAPAPTTVTAGRPPQFPPVRADDWISSKLGRPQRTRASN